MYAIKVILLLTVLVGCGRSYANEFVCVRADDEDKVIFQCENNEMICYVWDAEDGLKCELKNK